ncbi:hypothetical protein [Zavarzinia aquatilis]|uniref:Uncharacterized protein n=1 Tax=Zavarzinia aquatilis TaxID=2211142 RepID=A0A317DSP6_9PROT|nr:hypothetical protein [Zavarzinia aquatilis]PWR17708.1 hypothetical protein DKG74_20690 [Zavarzinia aquatilis]
MSEKALDAAAVAAGDEKQKRLYRALSAGIDIALSASEKDGLSVGDQLEVVAARLGHLVWINTSRDDREQMLLRLAAQMYRTSGLQATARSA